jgi:hypothetical protein
VPDHLDDLDADFLAVYGIDLEQQEITGARYFALAHRLTAYQGVMAARAEAEREPAEERGRPAAVRQQDDGGTREVSLTAFRVMFPGIVSGGGAAGGG